jgi:hypothetical protein
MGAKGQDLYIRGTERILSNLQIGTEFGYAKVGSTEISQVNLPRVEQKYWALDISYRPIPPLSMLLGYRYTQINNQDFVAGQSATINKLSLRDHLQLPGLAKARSGGSAARMRCDPSPPPSGP